MDRRSFLTTAAVGVVPVSVAAARPENIAVSRLSERMAELEGLFIGALHLLKHDPREKLYFCVMPAPHMHSVVNIYVDAKSTDRKTVWCKALALSDFEVNKVERHGSRAARDVIRELNRRPWCQRSLYSVDEQPTPFELPAYEV